MTLQNYVQGSLPILTIQWWQDNLQSIFSIPSGTTCLICVTCIFYKGLEKTQLPLILLDHITTCINREVALKCELGRGRQNFQASWEEGSKILVLCTPRQISAFLVLKQGQTENLLYCNHWDILDILLTSNKFETSFIDAFHIWVISQLPQTWKYRFLKWKASKSIHYIRAGAVHQHHVHITPHPSLETSSCREAGSHRGWQGAVITGVSQNILLFLRLFWKNLP